MTIAAPDPAALAKSIEAARTAEEPPWDPPLQGDLDMEITRDGTWFYYGSPIRRKPLVKLFSRVLRREADQRFYLVTPVEKRRIRVVDAPFVAVEVIASGAGREQWLSFRTNVDDLVTADESHPISVVTDAETGEPAPYVRVRGALDALIARPVFYELVELGVEETVDGARLYGVWSGGRFFAIGPAVE